MAALYYLFSFTGVSVLTAYQFFRGNPAPLVVFSFIIVSLLAVIGIVSVGTQAAADRYTYISLIPLYLLAGHFVSQVFFRVGIPRRMFIITLVFASLLFLAHVSNLQVKIWKNDISLWTYVSRGWTGSNTLPLTSLARATYENGDYEKAIEIYQIALSRGYVPPRHLLGLARSHGYLGNFDRALEVYVLMLNQDKLDESWKAMVKSDIQDIRKQRE